ncbi:Bestrophin, RFP-TM, chloride channel-domain-containing protein [Massariosphaeria phaeospora]|uniref:Bestrophin, RFP-TM, chloride channel-domain-containing protein n=1 Tax=Massariosphaeria phaeospora TaxID=100035 RepID=A0A7C8MG52_9PLEO|nr:Bestrophin, RFP-TM, chloride channel-domain-containing protein [Massariosphaeria phaeospora]
MTSSISTKSLKPHDIDVPSTSGGPPDFGGPMSPRSWKNGPYTRQAPSRKPTNASVDLDDYFVGPRDMSKHSKWPFFLRMHGSVLPKMLLPLLVVAAWSTLITCVSEFYYALKVKSILLTVLGFVVGLAISFRTSSAYERYTEGRRYWSQLLFVSQNLSRTIWLHANEREGDLGKEDLLQKLSALNLIVAYAVAVKHKLRFEPGIDYPDLKERIEYLDTFAKAAEADIPKAHEYGKMKELGEYLGVTFAESNPRKRIKRSKKPLGNLPLEILNHISSYVHSICDNKTMDIGLYQNQAINSVVALNEVLVGVERVLHTPLPVAYSIAISQITWVYVMMLPFQMWEDLRWVTIPGCIFAAYIILGIAAIGREIENPFGMDVNDLPLEAYCEELEMDIDVITATPRPMPMQFMRKPGNMPIWPLSQKSFEGWLRRDKHDVRDALMTKTKADMQVRRSMNPPRENLEPEKNSGVAQPFDQDEATLAAPNTSIDTTRGTATGNAASKGTMSVGVMSG